LQDVVQRVDRAFQTLFRRVKTGETPGCPRWQGRNRYNSVTYPQFGNGATLDNGFLVLSKIGRIAVHWSRPVEGTPKTVTVSREAGSWYVGCSCADVPAQPLPPTGQEIGVDLGWAAFAPTSDGARLFHPGWYRMATRRLKTAQRRVARRKKGSNRRRKAVQLLAKAPLKGKRQRADFQQKVALHRVGAHDTIDHAALQTANLLKNHHRATSSVDAGWRQLVRILAAKAAYAGRRVVAVPPASISHSCSGGGVIVAKDVSVRWHAYPDCGTSLHRDVNAAKNLQTLGQRVRRAVASPAAMHRASPGFSRGEGQSSICPRRCATS
jgi:putative transposase